MANCALLRPEPDNTSHAVVRKGFWEPVTATIDWCEDNYEVSEYIVEFWNAVSSLLFVVAGIAGVRWHGHLPVKARIAYLGVVLVGIGSFLFHGTLKFSMQLLDELPMLYTEAFMISCFCQLWILKAGILVFCLMFTAAYVHLKSPIIFQASYGCLQVICLGIYLSGVYRHKNKDLWRVFFCSVFFTAFAFLLWNLENHLCHSCIRPWKKLISVPVLLELHAWWHVFSCIGAYFFITGMAYLMPDVQAMRPVIVFCCFGLVPVLQVQSFERVSKRRLS